MNSTNVKAWRVFFAECLFFYFSVRRSCSFSPIIFFFLSLDDHYYHHNNGEPIRLYNIDFQSFSLNVRLTESEFLIIRASMAFSVFFFMLMITINTTNTVHCNRKWYMDIGVYCSISPLRAIHSIQTVQTIQTYTFDYIGFLFCRWPPVVENHLPP